MELVSSVERRVELLRALGAGRGDRDPVHARDGGAGARGLRSRAPGGAATSSSPARTSASAPAAAAIDGSLEQLGYEVEVVSGLAGVSSSEIRRRAARGRPRGRGCAARSAVRARRHRRPRRPARGDARLPDRQPRPRSGPARAAVRDLRGCRPADGRGQALSGGDLDRHESALRRAASGGSSRTCSTSRATSTASGSWSRSGSVSATRQVFGSESELVEQIARDVERTRAAVRPGVSTSGKARSVPASPRVARRSRPRDEADAAEVVMLGRPAADGAARRFEPLERVLVDPGFRVHE